MRRGSTSKPGLLYSVPTEILYTDKWNYGEHFRLGFLVAQLPHRRSCPKCEVEDVEASGVSSMSAM